MTARHAAVEELFECPALRNRFTLCLQELGDLERVAGRIRQGTAVRNEVLGLREYLSVVPTVRDLLQSCEFEFLLALADELDPCPQVSELIGRALVQSHDDEDEGEEGRLIRQGFHAELDELFASISRFAPLDGLARGA